MMQQALNGWWWWLYRNDLSFDTGNSFEMSLFRYRCLVLGLAVFLNVSVKPFSIAICWQI